MLMNLSPALDARGLYEEYPSFRVDTFPERKIDPSSFHAVIEDIIGRSGGREKVKVVGHSFEGRPIRQISIGTGETTVLLWTQMHGDEPTATAAVADILNYFSMAKSGDAIAGLLSSLTLHFIPLLNPDGAQRFRRRTVQQIDMNRDALALATPEARILRSLQENLRPNFGFNLHDQELSTVAGTKELAAIALLAPAFDQAKSINAVRARAISLAATFAMAMKELVPGKVTRYDDTFEPRAFGDNMQKWGTSTVLVESGHSMNDPRKDLIRRLNAVGILVSLYALASGECIHVPVAEYETLPFNGKKAYDIIIRNVSVDFGNERKSVLDLGISYQVDTHSEHPPRLMDAGDLHTHIGLEEVDAEGRSLSGELITIGESAERILKQFTS